MLLILHFCDLEILIRLKLFFTLLWAWIKAKVDEAEEFVQSFNV